LNPPDTRRRCAAQLPEGFREDSEPVFAEPWQAQAFALTVSLIESGRISWNQWADALGEEIAHADDHGIAEDGSGYYELWLRATEKLVEQAGLLQRSELSQLKEDWRQAYLHTPHGKPVTLPDRPTP
jgi:nitrile hydratase accessory protein